MIRSAGIAFFLALFVASPLNAVENFRSSQPIDIVADRLEANDAAGQVKFSGRVVATQGDATLYSHQMIFFLQSKSREVERVEAFGDVRIVQGDRIATGQKGIFYRPEGRIVLTGDPKVHQGKDWVAGEEIVVFLNEQRSLVRSGEKARVKATFHPKEEKKEGQR